MLKQKFTYNNQLENQTVKNTLSLKVVNTKELGQAVARGAKFVEAIRANNKFSMEDFLSLYDLSKDEGVAILGLAEALLRVSDYKTSQELISDKLSDKNWEQYLFKSNLSFKTLATSFGLYFSGKFTDIIKYNNPITKIINRLGQRIFVTTVKAAILYLSKEFVFAKDMREALEEQRSYQHNKFAFDLLGESSRTQKQANRYYKQYQEAITLISSNFEDSADELFDRPNLSVKLTALHPRFEYSKLNELSGNFFNKVVELVKQAAHHNLTITFDAEECFRTDIYLVFLEKLLRHKDLTKYNGIGLVVQAYQIKSLDIIHKIAKIAKETKKIIPIRLVKGAYWDTEIKHAQELGLKNYPVFTIKEYTDLNYIACAKQLFSYSDELYPQFATHNALTAATILEMGKSKKFEFQKLHGMGNVLHTELSKERNVRIYAPVGVTKDLLAYLMRRMLENGASANFVSKVNDKSVPISDIVYNINDKVLGLLDQKNKIVLPENIYSDRKNAMGYELGYKNDYHYIEEKVASYFDKVHEVGSIIDGREIIKEKHAQELFCPAKNAQKFSSFSNATENEINTAIDAASKSFDEWTNTDLKKRCLILNKIADEFEKNKFEIYALLIKEAGKSIPDAINEVIEAIDFCRYYANQAPLIMTQKKMPSATGENNFLSMHGRGVFLCISPWNFPFAIFAGQIVAALVTGNTVIAKSAEPTPVIANYAVKLMHKAGIPESALSLVFASGATTSKYIVANPKISGVVFTGSCATAKKINMTLAESHDAIIPLIAETGGQNAMIVDSSSLLEQVTDDVLNSAFYSAGQRCSALRILYVQEEIYDELLDMLKKAMSLIKIGDTADFSNDVGAVINKVAKDHLTNHIKNMDHEGFTITPHPQNNALSDGHYFYPHIVEVNSINDIEEEKFGPILHITKYKANNVDDVIDEINDCGFGLTFGIHSRIEARIDYIKSKMKVGNIYANRSITGAKVESQPFGGQGKSGTGFKAGGPHYLTKFITERTTTINITAFGGNVELLNL
ncbi:MAG: hypothetical protein DGJ47_000678 [Rickettsiaceae bacterium]